MYNGIGESSGLLKCDGTRAETRFLLSAQRTGPFKSAGASVQLTTGNRGVRISGSDAGYTMFRGSVKCTGYPLHSPVFPSLPLPCVTVCHHISAGVYCWVSHWRPQTSSAATLCPQNEALSTATHRISSDLSQCPLNPDSLQSSSHCSSSQQRPSWEANNCPRFMDSEVQQRCYQSLSSARWIRSTFSQLRTRFPNRLLPSDYLLT